MEKGVAKMVAQVEKKMGQHVHVDPQEHRRCCQMLVAIAALQPDHTICGDFAEQAVQSGHWVGKEIERINGGEVYNFDNILSFNVGGDPTV